MKDRLGEIKDQIRELEAVVNPEAKEERLSALQLQVSGHATQLFRTLPFDANYGDVQLLFDARKATVLFVRGTQVMAMRDIGGDESYLSGRVSTVLALHRVFAAGSRPVPGVVIFDQLSRPFYPPETNRDEIVVTATDRADLKQYFEALFKEVEAQKTLQIIVLEHAYFPDDDRYKAAVVRRWSVDDRLIPADWPRRGENAEAARGLFD